MPLPPPRSHLAQGHRLVCGQVPDLEHICARGPGLWPSFPAPFTATRKTPPTSWPTNLAQKGVKNIVLYDVSHTDVSYLVSEAFRCSHLVFASATYNGEIYTPMEDFIRDLKSHGLRQRSVALIENGTWAAQSGRLMTALLESMKDMRVMEGTVTLKSSVKEAQRRSLEALADNLAAELLH